jgi:hypothetical protein
LLKVLYGFYRADAGEIHILASALNVEHTRYERDKGYTVRLGFQGADVPGTFSIGGVKFRDGDAFGNAWEAHRGDVEDVLRYVRDARRQANVDADCDAVTGHGPHRLRRPTTSPAVDRVGSSGSGRGETGLAGTPLGGVVRVWRSEEPRSNQQHDEQQRGQQRCDRENKVRTLVQEAQRHGS